MPALIAALEASAIPWTIGPRETAQLIRLVRRYEVYLMPLSDWLVIPLPAWIPAADEGAEPDDADEAEDRRRQAGTRAGNDQISSWLRAPASPAACCGSRRSASHRGRASGRSWSTSRDPRPRPGPSACSVRRPARRRARQHPDRLDGDAPPAAGPPRRLEHAADQLVAPFRHVPSETSWSASGVSNGSMAFGSVASRASTYFRTTSLMAASSPVAAKGPGRTAARARPRRPRRGTRSATPG